jgi:hypothetical protein
VHHLIDVVAGDNLAFEDMGTLSRFLQVELCTADGNLVTMFDKVADALCERQQLGAQLRMVVLVGHQCNVVDRE